MTSERLSSLSGAALAVGKRIKGLRDFLELLEENGQLARWSEPVMPEPDIRNISVAAGRDADNGPAVIIDNILGYPGKRIVIGVHGSFTNLALLLGRPRGTGPRELFFEVVNRWSGEAPLIDRVAANKAVVHTNRVEQGIDLYDLLPLHRINEYDGGFYIDKANVVSRDPCEPENFNKQNVGIYRIQVNGLDLM